ncbi:MAG: short-chain dehydrogenase [Halobacteriovoraceae bacterium]|nr:short-chain dehydrogenase [Halobacteriovoraceae bacterium]|tara:strand:+ start:153 stop:917 length:765 start_codon:yes stop_codon:yes gene_type:complete
MKIFITGGTSGIGWALAEYYINEGHQVGVCGRDLNKLPEASKPFLGKELSCFEVDVTDRVALLEAIETFAKGKLDLLIANAGISQGDKSSHPKFTTAREILKINLDGFLNTFEAGFNIMKKEGGQLVAISSVAGFVGLPGAAAYCGSKSALLKMCESFSIDFKKFGIEVTTIAPGFIDTPLTRKNKHPMPFLMDSKKAAIKISKAISKKKSLYIFPLRMKLLIILLEKMPRSLYRFIMSFSRFAYPSHYEEGHD